MRRGVSSPCVIGRRLTLRLVWGTVASIDREGSGAQRLSVVPDGGPVGHAMAYPRLTGRCSVGDRVLLNTTATDLELGTGGTHFVVCRTTGGTEGPAQGVNFDSPSGGHVMKLRYTPLQLDVLSVEAQESEYHDSMSTAVSLDGMPVVCCGLHSQVPLVAAAIKRSSSNSRVAYCMTDGAALPAGLSDVVHDSVEAGLVDTTISCGQAFGGMLEAVNLHSGLLAARHVGDANVAVVAIGPGVVGTATPFGHGGIAQGEAVNAVTSLGGTPVFCLRVSFADARDRHRGVSHHSLSALSHIALAPAIVATPTLPQEFSDAIHTALRGAGVAERHQLIESPEGSVPPPSLRGIEVRSMGRGPLDDPAFFAASYAAGEIASRYIHSVRE